MMITSLFLSYSVNLIGVIQSTIKSSNNPIPEPKMAANPPSKNPANPRSRHSGPQTDIYIQDQFQLQVHTPSLQLQPRILLSHGNECDAIDGPLSPLSISPSDSDSREASEGEVGSLYSGEEGWVSLGSWTEISDFEGDTDGDVEGWFERDGDGDVDGSADSEGDGDDEVNSHLQERVCSGGWLKKGMGMGMGMGWDVCQVCT